MNNNIEISFEDESCYYRYNVIIYDEMGEAESAPYRGIKGVIYAESIMDAMNKLAEYYGPDNIEEIHISVEERTCYEFFDVGMKYDYETNSYIEAE